MGKVSALSPALVCTARKNSSRMVSVFELAEFYVECAGDVDARTRIGNRFVQRCRRVLGSTASTMLSFWFWRTKALRK